MTIVTDTPPNTTATPTPVRGASTRRRGLLAVGLLLIALNLRIGVASLSPVISSVRESLGISATLAGLLTTVPVLCFGIFSFVTPWLERTVGMHRLLTFAVAVLAAAIISRLIPGSPALFAGTTAIGAAIAIGNVVLPAAIKESFADRTGLMMALYSTALFVGAAIASGLSAPLTRAVGGNWQLSLALWSIPAVIAVILWAPQQGRAKNSPTGGDHPGDAVEPSFTRLLRDPIAIAVTAFMGLKSLGYYAALAWVPTILHDHGMTMSAAGLMLSYSSLPAIAATLSAPALARRISRTWVPALIAVVLTAGGYLGLAIAPTAGTLVWMTLLGLGQGAALTLSLSYIVWRAPDARHTAHLSTMAQGLGYLLAAIGPIGLGAVHTITGAWTVPLIVLLALLVPQAVAAAVAALPRHVNAQPITR